MSYIQSTRILSLLFVCFVLGAGGCGGSGGGGGTLSPSLQSIQVSPANASIPRGATQQFTARGTFTDGSSQDVTGSVAWSSSVPSVASISSAGLATGVAAGSATITAASRAVSGSTPVTVTLPSPRFAYVANGDDGSVSIYAVDAASGQMRPNGYVLTDGYPVSVTVDPSGK